MSSFDPEYFSRASIFEECEHFFLERDVGDPSVVSSDVGSKFGGISSGFQVILLVPKIVLCQFWIER